MSDKEYLSSPEKSLSPASNSKLSPPRVKRSRSRSHSKKKHSRSRSRSYGRKRYYSRSRSRSPYGRRKHYPKGGSRSRSRSYSPYYSRRDRDDYGGGSRRSSNYYRSRSRSPMSSRRRHTSSREQPKTSRCLGVFGLSLYTQERDLREAFSRYGPVEEVQVVYDHQTGRSRGFAFIYFRNLEDAEDAKERAPGTEIDGRKCRCDYSITERAHTPTPGIYLGKPSGGYSRSSRRSASPYESRDSNRKRGYSHSRSRSRSYSPRRY